MPKAHLTYIVTAAGQPRSKYGLGNDFSKWATEAGLPARCRLHGLKKSALARLAEDGATAHELMAISGHRTLTEVQRYTEAAEKLRLADSAMAKKNKKIADVTNTAPPLHKHGAISLKSKGRENLSQALQCSSIATVSSLAGSTTRPACIRARLFFPVTGAGVRGACFWNFGD
jgi:hypothetical protein